MILATSRNSLANGVGGESRQRLWPRCGRGARRAAGLTVQFPGDLEQLGLGNRVQQCVELLVQQADLLAVSDPECLEVRLRPRDLAGPFA